MARRSDLLILALSFLSFCAAVIPAHATTWVVTSLADEMTNNGSCSLREAVEAANTNAARDTCPAGSAIATDFIVLAAAGTLNLSLGEFIVSDDLTIIGPGDDALTINAGTASRIFLNDEAFAVDFTVTDLALVNGRANVGGAVRGGGDAALRFERVSFLLNEATFRGGAIDVSNGDLVVLHCEFRLNHAEAFGGAIGDGGVVSSIFVGDSEFVDNTAGRSGGAIDSDGTLTVEDSRFHRNTAQSGSQSSGGGAIWADAETIVRRSLFDGNRGLGELGGGAMLLDGTAQIVNSTILGNEGTVGGGLYVFGDLGLFNTVVARNSSVAGAGNLQLASNATLTTSHSIFAEGAPTNGCGFPSGFTTLSLGFNIDDDGSCGLTGIGDLPNADPKLGGLGDWGGPTMTLLPSVAGPAVDGGASTGCADENGGTLLVDQRGATRPIDADGDLTAQCDIGPVEVEAGYSGLFADGFESGDALAW